MRSRAGMLAFVYSVAAIAVAPLMALTPQTPSGQPEAGMLSTVDATTHIGKAATVCGKVVDHQHVVAEGGIETLLYLDRPISEAAFAIRILGGRRQTFRPSPEKQYGNQETCVFLGSMTKRFAR
jgi:hypothetical protein